MPSTAKLSFFERAVLGMQEIVGGQYLVDDAFVARVKRKVYTRCSQVPQVYSRNKLARRMEQAACEAVVEAWLGHDWEDEGIGAVRVPITSTVAPTMGERIRKTFKAAPPKPKQPVQSTARPAIPRRK